MQDNGDQTCVYSWGSTASFLRNLTGHARKEDLPRIIEIFDTARIVKVACSSMFSMALSANGRVWWWGCKPDFPNLLAYVNSTPTVVSGLQDIFIKDIACTTPGGDCAGHCACISDKQELYMWGQNTYYQIGNYSEYVENPVKIMGHKFVEAACGDYHTVAIGEGGDVYTWGYKVPVPTLTLAGAKAVKVGAGGGGLSAVLTADHTLYTWAKSSGVSEGDFLGHGESKFADIGAPPKPVTTLLHNVKQFSCGWIHMGAVTLTGDLYTWGEGDTNRLGHGVLPRQSRHKHVPTLVEGMEGTHIKKLTLSRGNEGAITESGDVYTWGGPDHGGHHMHATPTKLELSSTFFQEAEVKDLSCGKSHTLIVLHMRTSLRYLCIRTIAEYIDDILPVLVEAPVVLREAVASFLDDRRKLTDEHVALLGIEFSPCKPPPQPIPFSLQPLGPQEFDVMMNDVNDEYHEDDSDDEFDDDEAEDDDDDDSEDEDGDDDEDEDEDEIGGAGGEEEGDGGAHEDQDMGEGGEGDGVVNDDVLNVVANEEDGVGNEEIQNNPGGIEIEGEVEVEGEAEGEGEGAIPQTVVSEYPADF